VLAAVSKDDTAKDIESMASKVTKVKLWDDDSKNPPGRVSAYGTSNIANPYWPDEVEVQCARDRRRGSLWYVARQALLSCRRHAYLKVFRAGVLITKSIHWRTVVSQFTLLASVKKGNKPDFHHSASGDTARALYQAFYMKVGELYEPDKVKDGVFAAMMDVTLVNDGPVGSTVPPAISIVDSRPILRFDTVLMSK
jgi:D-tyrosyl-tRNA(Tyr) deacylase